MAEDRPVLLPGREWIALPGVSANAVEYPAVFPSCQVDTTVSMYSVRYGGFADVSLFDESPHGCPPPGGGCPEGAGGERDPRKP